MFIQQSFPSFFVQEKRVFLRRLLRRRNSQLFLLQPSFSLCSRKKAAARLALRRKQANTAAVWDRPPGRLIIFVALPPPLATPSQSCHHRRQQRGARPCCHRIKGRQRNQGVSVRQSVSPPGQSVSEDRFHNATIKQASKWEEHCRSTKEKKQTLATTNTAPPGVLLWSIRAISSKKFLKSCLYVSRRIQ